MLPATEPGALTAADWIVVAAFVVLGLALMYALWKSWLSQDSGIQVTRGRESLAALAATFLATLGALAFFVSNSNFPAYVKDILYVVGAAVLGYLFLESEWFQNLLVRLQIRFASKSRGHG